MNKILLSCALASFMMLNACSPKSDKANAQSMPKTVEVGYVDVAPQFVSIKNELSGRVVATVSSEVRPQASGIIKKMLFTEGSFVKAGQPLYQLDPATYQASYEQVDASYAQSQAAYGQSQASLLSAKTSLDAAKIKADKYRSLKDIDAVSKQDRDTAYADEKSAKVAVQQAEAALKQSQAAVKIAQANLKSSQINLQYTTIRAPVSGYISASNVTIGSLVTSSQTTALATIRKLDPIYVDVEQSSADILKLRNSLLQQGKTSPSVAVNIKTEDGNLYPYQGILQFAERTVDEATGAITLRAKVSNPNSLLLPGMFVKVEVPQYDMGNAILIPQQAVLMKAGNKGSAYVINAQNKVESRDVIVDKAIDDKWLISSGLKLGDRLLVEGRDKVKDGASVKPVKVDLDTQNNSQGTNSGLAGAASNQAK